MNTSTIVAKAKHLNIPFPTECFELTTDWTEAEVWEMSRNGLVTYDEADHMVDGMSQFEARIILAAYNCDCKICNVSDFTDDELNDLFIACRKNYYAAVKSNDNDETINRLHNEWQTIANEFRTRAYATYKRLGLI